MNKNFESTSPRLTFRLNSLEAQDTPEIQNLTEQDFEKYWENSKLPLSPQSRGKFSALLEQAKSRLRLEEARLRLSEKKENSDWLESMKTVIAKLSLSEVRTKLQECLSLPGDKGGVFARKLEDISEEDLRSMLLDFERTKNTDGQAKDH